MSQLKDRTILGMSRVSIIETLEEGGFDRKKLVRVSDDELAVIWDIAKRREIIETNRNWPLCQRGS